jgi:hypothetical protein
VVAAVFDISCRPKAIHELLGESDAAATSSTLTKRVNDVFKKIDKNGDNLLSSEEFIEGCLNDENLRKLLAPST